MMFHLSLMSSDNFAFLLFSKDLFFFFFFLICDLGQNRYRIEARRNIFNIFISLIRQFGMLNEMKKGKSTLDEYLIIFFLFFFVIYIIDTILFIYIYSNSSLNFVQKIFLYIIMSVILIGYRVTREINHFRIESTTYRIITIEVL